MKTNDLIDRLGANLAPVEPLAAPGRRALLWLLGGAAYLAAVVLVVGLLTRAEWAFDPGFIGTQLLGLLAAGLAAWAALESVIPGRSRHIQGFALAAAAAWLAAFLFLAVSRGAAEVSIAQTEWVCVVMIVLGGAPLVFALGTMLKKGAPISPLQSGVFLGIAVGLFANLAACLSSTHSDPTLAFVWHVSTVGALIVVCGLGGQAVLRWR